MPTPPLPVLHGARAKKSGLGTTVTEITSSDEPIRCDACPVLCRIRLGTTGACDRYGNVGGKLVRTDPLVLLERAVEDGRGAVRFLDQERDWDGRIVHGPDTFGTGIGATPTYPDYKPAPFIVSSQVEGVDFVTVVTEGIFSYCGVKVKIDTDRFIGPETAPVRANGEQVGHVTTHEYGSQMLSLGGVHHLTGGSKAEGNATCDALLALCNKQAVELSIDGGSTVVVQSNRAPVIDGVTESRMRVGCGSAVTGIFAKQWLDLADEVVVVDEHITGVFTEHQAGRLLDVRPSGLKIRGRKSTPGRYFKVAEPGMGWGGTNLRDPLEIIKGFDAKLAWPGLRLFMVSTTGEHYAWYVLDEKLVPQRADPPAAIENLVERIAENCEPALSTVLFMGGAGGSLRAGVTENPVRLTQSVKGRLTRVTCGGAPAYVWPGGGITVMVDVAGLPDNATGYVPTPALVFPIEFTMRLNDYAAMGGHMEHVVSLDQVKARHDVVLAGSRT